MSLFFLVEISSFLNYSLHFIQALSFLLLITQNATEKQSVCAHFWATGLEILGDRRLVGGLNLNFFQWQ